MSASDRYLAIRRDLARDLLIQDGRYSSSQVDEIIAQAEHDGRYQDGNVQVTLNSGGPRFDVRFYSR